MWNGALDSCPGDGPHLSRRAARALVGRGLGERRGRWGGHAGVAGTQRATRGCPCAQRSSARGAPLLHRQRQRLGRLRPAPPRQPLAAPRGAVEARDLIVRALHRDLGRPGLRVPAQHIDESIMDERANKLTNVLINPRNGNIEAESPPRRRRTSPRTCAPPHGLLAAHTQDTPPPLSGGAVRCGSSGLFAACTPDARPPVFGRLGGVRGGTRRGAGSRGPCPCGSPRARAASRTSGSPPRLCGTPVGPRRDRYVE